jgi:hypothetical protein
MASIQKRVRNDRVTYRVRYRDPAGRQRSRVFARKADAQRFLSETENAKLRGTWTDPALGRVRLGEWLEEWWVTTTNLRPSNRRPGCRLPPAIHRPALRRHAAGRDHSAGRACLSR